MMGMGFIIAGTRRLELMPEFYRLRLAADRFLEVALGGSRPKTVLREYF